MQKLTTCQHFFWWWLEVEQLWDIATFANVSVRPSQFHPYLRGFTSSILVCFVTVDRSFWQTENTNERRKLAYQPPPISVSRGDVYNATDGELNWYKIIYSARLHHWPWGNHRIAPVPSVFHEILKNSGKIIRFLITENATKHELCAYDVAYSVRILLYF